MRDPCIDEFHKRYYNNGLCDRMFWMGLPSLKSPFDLWIYQEIIHKHRPDVIIETGTRFGGTTLFLAHICQLLRHGRVYSIDTGAEVSFTHDRVTFISKDSGSLETAEYVKSQIQLGESVMAILDSDHSKSHVLNELRWIGDVVTPGQYLIVEDTNLNGNPVREDFGPGPKEAVDEFLQTRPDYKPDPGCEKFMFTLHPGGFLRRSPVAG